MNTDFDKINLTHKENFLLFKMRFNPNTPQDSLGESFKTFREYDLIRFNFQEAENEYSPKKYDGTVRLSDTYYRYCIHTRRNRFYRYLTPIIVALLTSIATNLLKELWLPVILNWLQGLF
jgi:hypothetical protein